MYKQKLFRVFLVDLLWFNVIYFIYPGNKTVFSYDPGNLISYTLKRDKYFY